MLSVEVLEDYQGAPDRWLHLARPQIVQPALPVKDQLIAYLQDSNLEAERPYGPYAEYEVKLAIGEALPTEDNKVFPPALQEKRARFLLSLVNPELFPMVEEPRRQKGKKGPMLNWFAFRERTEELKDKRSSWSVDGRCGRMDPDTFVVDIEVTRGGGWEPELKEFNDEKEAEFKEACAGCPVKDECLAYGREHAIEKGEKMPRANGQYSIYGGLYFIDNPYDIDEVDLSHLLKREVPSEPPSLE